MKQSKFKETEIGEIPEGWNLYVFSQAIDVNPQRELKKGAIAKKVSMQGLQEFRRKIASYERAKYNGGTKFQNNDTLMARITPCLENGKTAFVDILDNNEIGFGSTEFNVLCGEEGKTNHKFVYYLSRSPLVRAEAINSMVGTSGRQRVQNDVFDNMLVPIPSIAEQKSIAKVLSDLDSKIELNNEMNRTLEAIGQAILKHWFVDFEFPNEKGKPYKSSGGEMVDSELGEIPEGWRVNIFSEVVGVNPKRSLPKGVLAKKISMTDLIPWQSWIDHYEIVKYDSGPKFIGGDTLLARITPSLEHGKTAIVSLLKEGEVGFGSTEFIVMTPQEITSCYYIFYLARSREVRDFAIGSMTGTSGRQRVPSDCFDYLKIIVPPEDLIQKYHNIATPIFDKITANSLQTRELESIRDALLPRLMSGRIRVGIKL